ncbi:MAG: FAD-dependent oxidoreductase, partial [Coleofasciculaceae cyanobacterium SM2_3_26]|nr:FAD-dependent oxidoreductase [Coleofasciculaceae cyanobacterium SM2_3_26]
GTIQYADIEQTKVRLYAANFIDATQNAELARKAGLAYYQGFESQRADLYNETLAVSVVPVTIGITIQDFQEIERQIFQNPELMSALETRVRDYQPPEGANFWLGRFREPIVHLYPDGFAVRSVALGAAYLLYRNQPFTLDGFFFDRSNVCAVGQPDVLSWNGFLFKYPVDRILEIEAQGYRPTPDMIAEMTAFEGWLQEVTGREVRVVLPPEVYVRHSVSIQDVLDPLTGLEIARGGTPPATSVGSFPTNSTFAAG